MSKSAGRPLSPRRRHFLQAATLGAAVGLSGCMPPPPPPTPARWVGASHARGHRIRDVSAWPAAAVQRRAAVLVLGAGVAGLAAARGFLRRGMDDIRVLELEDRAGGNSRGHAMDGMACPLGAHYLPLPGPQAHEVAEWLYELGLLRHELGRTVADERHLCHSPQERLFFEGAWMEGLLPPAPPGSEALRQMQAFSEAVAALRSSLGARGAPAFALPAHRGAWGPTHQALDAQTFAHWLDARGLTSPPLRWYLDYCCRDDYGAGPAVVSAWAGLHYFASRHGFHAPGGAASGDDEAGEGVFTWPEGNAWLVHKLTAPLGERLLPGRTVLRVTEGRHEVEVLAWDEAGQRLEAWVAPQVVMALPLFVAARVLATPPPALREAAARLVHAPWLVANLQLDAPLLDRVGAPPSWDNVVYGGRGLGYVDAMHQSLRPVSGATVLTAYHALSREDRALLLATDPAPWVARVLDELRPAHPDIDRRVQAVDLMRWGHAMAVPTPGLQRHPALQALRAGRGRVRYAHADLGGYSVFEEAFTAGCEAALP